MIYQRNQLKFLANFSLSGNFTSASIFTSNFVTSNRDNLIHIRIVSASKKNEISQNLLWKLSKILQLSLKNACRRWHRHEKLGFLGFHAQHRCSWTIRSEATKRLSGNQDEWDSCEQAKRDFLVRIFHFYAVSRFGIFVQRFRISERRCLSFALPLLHIIKQNTIVLLYKCRKSPYIKPLESETSFPISLTQFDSL